MGFVIGKKSPLNTSEDVKQWREIKIKGDKKDGSDDIVFSLLISSFYSPRVRARHGYVSRSADAAANTAGAGTDKFKVTDDSVAAMLKIEEESLKTLAEEVIHDWKDVEAPDGSQAEYSVKDMVKILKDWPSIRSQVEQAAIEVGLGIEKQAEETLEK